MLLLEHVLILQLELCYRRTAENSTRDNPINIELHCQNSVTSGIP